MRKREIKRMWPEALLFVVGISALWLMWPVYANVPERSELSKNVDVVVLRELFLIKVVQTGQCWAYYDDHNNPVVIAPARCP